MRTIARQSVLAGQRKGPAPEGSRPKQADAGDVSEDVVEKEARGEVPHWLMPIMRYTLNLKGYVG